MIDIVVFLVFSIVLLLFMAFPAIKIAEFLANRFKLSSKVENFLVVFITIVLSLAMGAFLKYF